MGPKIICFPSSDRTALKKDLPLPSQMGLGTPIEVRKESLRGKIGRKVLNLAVLLLTATGAFGQNQFPAQAVGTSASQTVTVTAQIAGTVAAVQVLTMGNPNLDFTAGAG